MMRMRIARAPSSHAQRSFVRDLDLRQVVGVLGDARLEARAVAAARAVFYVLAERGDMIEDIGDPNPLHAVAQLAQLLEVRRSERDAQGVELLLAVGHEHRDEVLEIARYRDVIVGFVHAGHYRRPLLAGPGGTPAGPGQALSASASCARGRWGCSVSA